MVIFQIVLRLIAYNSTSISLNNCSNTTLVNLTGYSLSSFFWQEVYGYGNTTVENLYHTRYPYPVPGATIQPLIGGSGFWSQKVRHGPKVKNSKWEYDIDDLANTHNNFAGLSRVVSADKKVTLAVDASNYDYDFKPGEDRIAFYDANTNYLGTSIVLQASSSAFRLNKVSRIKTNPRALN